MLNNANNAHTSPEGMIHLDLFKKDIPYKAQNNDIDSLYIEKCITYINSISEKVIESLCDASIEHCNAHLSSIGEEPLKFRTNRSILYISYPKLLIIPEPDKDFVPAFHLILKCEWDKKNGMEWIVQNDTISYVGPIQS